MLPGANVMGYGAECRDGNLARRGGQTDHQADGPGCLGRSNAAPVQQADCLAKRTFPVW